MVACKNSRQRKPAGLQIERTHSVLELQLLYVLLATGDVMPFLKFNFVKSYARVVLLSTSVLVFLLSPSAQSTEYIRAITRNGVFTFENPVGSDGKAASVIVRGGGNEGLFIVTGEAADLLAGRQRTPVVRPKLSPLVFENLNFIINSKQNRVAAFYPLRPTASIELTALHTLKGNTLEKPLSDQRKLWGVLNPKTNKLMDIAIVADSGTSLEGLLAEIKIAIDSPKPMTDGYVEHLNEPVETTIKWRFNRFRMIFNKRILIP